MNHALKGVLYGTLSLLIGCTVGPNYHRPTIMVPQHYAIHKKQTNTQQVFIKQDIPKRWWELFHSKDLNQLVIDSIHNHPSIDSAKAALHNGLENYYASLGSLYPNVNMTFIPTKQQIAKILTPVLADNRLNFPLYTPQLNITYTLDLFGGLKRQRESLLASAKQLHYQLEGTYLTLTSNVVNAAIIEAGIREQIVTTKNIIRGQKRVLQILNQRLQQGDISIQDIATQESLLTNTEATLPILEKQLAIQRDLLNALSGRYPDDPNTPTFTFNKLHLPKKLPLTIPSSLMEQRPDIKAAEEQMHAANALIGVTVANRLPNISLTATNLGSTAETLTSLFTNNSWFWAASGLIIQPLLDGKSLYHRQKAAEALYKQAAADYRLTVINAFQNVTDTLKSIEKDSTAFVKAERSAMAAQRNLTISRNKFDLGESDKLSLLLTQQMYTQSQFNFISSKTNRYIDTVALFYALGGGWWNCNNNEVHEPLTNRNGKHRS